MFNNTDKFAFGLIEAAARLGVPVLHIRVAVRNGQLNVHKIGNRSLIWRDDLEKWFRLHPAPHDRRKRINVND